MREENFVKTYVSIVICTQRENKIKIEKKGENTKRNLDKKPQAREKETFASAYFSLPVQSEQRR